MPSQKPTIYVEVNGGLVQDVTCNEAAARALEYLKSISFGLGVVVVDYDNDGTPREELGLTFDKNGIRLDRAHIGEYDKLEVGGIDSHKENP